MPKSDQTGRPSNKTADGRDASDYASTVRVPLVSEQFKVDKRRPVKARVRVTMQVDQEELPISTELRHEAADIQRVPIGHVVETTPMVREEGDVTIIPVLEEILVVEKRLLLKEEIHVRRQATTSKAEQTVTLRKERADIERF